MIEDCAERMAWVLAAVVREYSRRAEPDDAPLPMSQQDPVIQMADSALNDYQKVVGWSTQRRESS